MTGPTASISFSVALPGVSVPPSLLSVAAPAGVRADVLGAVPSLATFIDLMIAQPAVTPEDVSPVDDRQRDAAPGNVLPDGKKDETTDPALAWLMAAPVATPPTAAAPVVKTGGAAPVVTLDVEAKAPAAPLPRPIDPRPMPDTQTPEAVIVADPAAATTPAEAPARTLAPTINTVEADDTPLADSTAPAPVAPPTRSATAVRTAPLAQTIATAMLHTPQAQPVMLARALAANANLQPALFALAMDRSSDDTETRPIFAATTAATLLQPADAAALIAKPGEAQRQALDMGQPDWPQKMIDRIETLRDNANANDTSIRLKPEALGRVDISLKAHADGVVSVRFTAEQASTRSLIADAAPQLQAAAEARGIRLSQTNVDLSGSGQSDRQRQPFELKQNSSNRLASNGEADTNAVADGRIA